ncbi:hypothetical protein HMN09_00886600 [Mycena chlorophos]|uniref:Uncharacterized protein n=1 Tax=Mycena chlorophos TaxID=658473 RepID=A0A8H6W2G3_MYCCL|nr:hypothetical protein HMN09_00886600 [Mycena chlorophos]
MVASKLALLVSLATLAVATVVPAELERVHKNVKLPRSVFDNANDRMPHFPIIPRDAPVDLAKALPTEDTLPANDQRKSANDLAARDSTNPENFINIAPDTTRRPPFGNLKNSVSRDSSSPSFDFLDTRQVPDTVAGKKMIQVKRNPPVSLPFQPPVPRDLPTGKLPLAVPRPREIPDLAATTLDMVDGDKSGGPSRSSQDVNDPTVLQKEDSHASKTFVQNNSQKNPDGYDDHDLAIGLLGPNADQEEAHESDETEPDGTEIKSTNVAGGLLQSHSESKNARQAPVQTNAEEESQDAESAPEQADAAPQKAEGAPEKAEGAPQEAHGAEPQSSDETVVNNPTNNDEEVHNHETTDPNSNTN